VEPVTPGALRPICGGRIRQLERSGRPRGGWFRDRWTEPRTRQVTAGRVPLLQSVGRSLGVGAPPFDGAHTVRLAPRGRCRCDAAAQRLSAATDRRSPHWLPARPGGHRVRDPRLRRDAGNRRCSSSTQEIACSNCVVMMLSAAVDDDPAACPRSCPRRGVLSCLCCVRMNESSPCSRLEPPVC